MEVRLLHFGGVLVLDVVEEEFITPSLLQLDVFLRDLFLCRSQSCPRLIWVVSCVPAVFTLEKPGHA